MKGFTPLRAVVLLTGLLLGCSSDDAPDDGGRVLGSCGLRATVTGSSPARFDGSADVACLTAHSFGQDLRVTFVQLPAERSIHLTILGAAEGSLGDFPTTAVYQVDDEPTWKTEHCTSSVSEHALVSREINELGELRRYQVSGEGRCGGVLTSSSGTEAELSDYLFRALFIWRG